MLTMLGVPTQLLLKDPILGSKQQRAGEGFAMRST